MYPILLLILPAILILLCTNGCDGAIAGMDSTAVGLSAVVLLFAIFRLFFEVVQLVSQRLSYLKDWINLVEISQYICTVIFVWIYHNDCSCALFWQWEVGVAAVFLSWIVMILFVTKVPFIGIYVLILVQILFTFLKFVVLAGLLVVAFSLSFYMTFFDFSVMVS